MGVSGALGCLVPLKNHEEDRGAGVERARKVRGQQFSVKGQVVNILGCVGHRMPGTTTLLCHVLQGQSYIIHKQMSMAVF